MNKLNFNWILYLIAIVILATIGIQTYWNYKNYQVNKKQLVNSVQQVLDGSVNGYYELKAMNSTIGFSFNQDMDTEFFKDDGVFDSIVKEIDLARENFGNLDSVRLNTMEGVQVFRGRYADSLIRESHNPLNKSFNNQVRIETHDHELKDSIELKDFQLLTSKVILSISSDTLNIKQLDSLVGDKLNNQNLDLNFKLVYKALDSSVSHSKEEVFKDPLEVYSKSTFLPGGSALSMQFSNETMVLLKQSMTGIIISTLLVLAIISSLFYLLKIIRNQKQLAEVKNDLISNITHEFKTPISTIGVALESIQNFDVIQDKEKTKSYLKMSEEQLKKLNTMVEKLLETATLDSDEIALSKENFDLMELFDSLAEHYRISFPEKSIVLNKPDNEFAIVADRFHFENALSNIIDNAAKYGGSEISITVTKNQGKAYSIIIHDNGAGFDPSEKDKVFDKFYRVQKGNTHDVKGFGIGLFYTKAIIEKHGGKISIDLNKTGTSFIITMPI
ncbi:MAG: HAMP domain-containing histidine kinase [Bacteroidia bacterium]|nr:HAMP domain-containing histidine kinase [Bacteroidia bacterium]